MPFDGTPPLNDGRAVLIEATRLLRKHGVAAGAGYKRGSYCPMQAILVAAGSRESWAAPLTYWPADARQALAAVSRAAGVTPTRLWLWSDELLWFRKTRILRAMNRALEIVQ
jgi:hypothetical protein